MPRPKLLSDEEVLDRALGLIRAGGPEALSFASLSAAAGLSGAALVQRFGGKEALLRAALLRAWDGLDTLTTRLDAELPEDAGGAVALLVALSAGFGGIEAHADGLRVLREDYRDPALRARGRAWVAALTRALDRRVPRQGPTLAALWQGTVMLWGFAPDAPLAAAVRARLEAYLASLEPFQKP